MKTLKIVLFIFSCLFVFAFQLNAENKIKAVKIGLAHCCDAVGVEGSLLRDRNIGLSYGVGLIWSVSLGPNFSFFLGDKDNIILVLETDFAVSLPESFSCDKFRPYLIPRFDFNYFFNRFGLFISLQYPLINRPHNVQTISYYPASGKYEIDSGLSMTDIISLGVTWKWTKKGNGE